MSKPPFVAGIDGGGTKTAAVLADLTGKVLAEENGGPSNFQIIGVEKASQALFSLIAKCCEKVGCSLSDVKGVVAGLTGAGRQTDQDRMRDAFASHAKQFGATFDRLRIESDARIALEGAFRGASGIILISGTGSIAFGKASDGSILRVGGWGRLVGDEGGGHAIGSAGMNAVAKELDGRGKKTMLTRLLAEEFGLSNQEKIIAEVYRNNFDLASLAPLVIEAAAKHDLESERILNRAAFELAEHVRALTLKMEAVARGARQKIPLAFVGGLLTNGNIFEKVVRHKIEFSIPQITIVKPQASPAQGAILLALELLKN